MRGRVSSPSAFIASPPANLSRHARAARRATPRATHTEGPSSDFSLCDLVFRTVAVATVAVSCLIFASLGPSQASVLKGAPRVIDGDTLVISGTRIRLRAVDAPELGQTCITNTGPQPCGKKARDKLVHIIQTAGGVVECQQSYLDRYNRVVAVCHAGPIDIAHALVDQGWAVAYRRYGKDYASAEVQARAAKRYVVNSHSPTPPTTLFS